MKYEIYIQGREPYIYIYRALNKKSLNLKRVLYPKLYDDMAILFLDPFLEPYKLFNYIIYIRLP